MDSIEVVKSPLDMFYQWEAANSDSIYLQQPIQGEWSDFTWREVGQQARSIAAALQSLGVKKADRVCILSQNCAHWIMADLAIMMSGGSSAPTFTTMTPADVMYILEHSDSKVLLVGQTSNWQGLKEVLPDDITVIAMPNTDIPEADYQWESLLEDHQPLQGNPQRDDDDELTVIYTSGSTGQPKGVRYSFIGAGYIAHNLAVSFRVTQDDRFISYLPMAHGFERGLIDFMSMHSGFTVGFNETLDTFADDLRTVEPTVFHSVPRLWTKFQEGVVGKFGGQQNLDAMLSNPEQAEAVKAKIKQGLGLNQGRLFLTGSAPTPLALHDWYNALEMPLCEIYGQSEILSGTANLPWDRKLGTLGKPTHNTQIKIADNGEILIKAKSVMMGYLNEPEKTAETLRDDWIYTGDKGELDEDGYLTLTGRVKEIFKTAKGKYVAPVPIEGSFVSNPYIEQICLVGSGLAHTALVIQLSEKSNSRSRAELADALRQQVEQVNAGLHSHEKIACVLVSVFNWDSERGFITHTMKIKRSPIEKHYLPIIEKLFLQNVSTDEPLIKWEVDMFLYL